MDIHDFVLNELCNGNSKLSSILIKQFVSAKEVLSTDDDYIREVLNKNGISEGVVSNFMKRKGMYASDSKSFISDCNSKIRRIREVYKIDIITISDSEYPEQLRYISDPPLVLYLKGSLSFDYNKSIAVVGTRNASSYALERVTEICAELAREGYCVISGLARGIDGAAHRAVINEKGKTISVLALGINYIYPPEHKTLSEEILLKKGALVSENFSEGKTLSKSAFKERNRIISGLSKAVLIVEGSERSGSLSQYNHAREQGKIIMTIKPSFNYEVSYLPKKIYYEGGFVIEDAKQIMSILDKYKSF